MIRLLKNKIFVWSTVLSLLASGLLVAVFVSTSMAAFTDKANMNMSNTGLGNNTKFDIGLVSATGNFVEANSAGSALFPIVGGDGLVPGKSVTTDIVVANNSSYKAALNVAIVGGGTGGTGAVGSAPNITPFLLFSVQDLTTNAYLFGGATQALAVGLAAATGTTGPLVSRAAAPLTDGQPWVAGAAGSFRTLRVTIFYPNTAATNNTYNGGLSSTILSVTGSSV